MYFIKSINTVNCSPLLLETLFPIIDLSPKNKYGDIANYERGYFYWFRLFDNIHSLVYIPFLYPTKTDRGKLIYSTKNGNHTTTSICNYTYGIKLVSPKGNTVIIEREDEVFESIALATRQELLNYRDIVSVPSKYRGTLHRMLDKAVTRNY